MMIIGCDFHPRFQQIAFVDKETGELLAKLSPRRSLGSRECIRPAVIVFAVLNFRGVE
jgi:hypothetical protein